jgi:hypothetical protein
MLRLVGGVLLGYVAMFAVVFFGLTAVYFGLGADRAFESGTYDVSLIWIACHFAVALFAAVVGGIVAAAVSRRWLAPVVLAIVVAILGIASAIMELSVTKPDPGPRTGDVSNLEAMTRAKQPPSIALTLPLLGAVGVLLGARLLNPKSPATSPPAV